MATYLKPKPSFKDPSSSISWGAVNCLPKPSPTISWSAINSFNSFQAISVSYLHNTLTHCHKHYYCHCQGTCHDYPPGDALWTVVEPSKPVTKPAIIQNFQNQLFYKVGTYLTSWHIIWLDFGFIGLDGFAGGSIQGVRRRGIGCHPETVGIRSSIQLIDTLFS